MMAVHRPASGLRPGGDGEGHGQRQGDDADREAGAQVAQEALAVVAAQGVEQAGTEGEEGSELKRAQCTSAAEGRTCRRRG